MTNRAFVNKSLLLVRITLVYAENGVSDHLLREGSSWKRISSGSHKQFSLKQKRYASPEFDISTARTVIGSFHSLQLTDSPRVTCKAIHIGPFRGETRFPSHKPPLTITARPLKAARSLTPEWSTTVRPSPSDARSPPRNVFPPLLRPQRPSRRRAAGRRAYRRLLAARQRLLPRHRHLRPLRPTPHRSLRRQPTGNAPSFRRAFPHSHPSAAATAASQAAYAALRHPYSTRPSASQALFRSLLAYKTFGKTPVSQASCASSCSSNSPWFVSCYAAAETALHEGPTFRSITYPTLPNRTTSAPQATLSVTNFTIRNISLMCQQYGLIIVLAFGNSSFSLY